MENELKKMPSLTVDVVKELGVVRVPFFAMISMISVLYAFGWGCLNRIMLCLFQDYLTHATIHVDWSPRNYKRIKGQARSPLPMIGLGMVGLDTSHASEFARRFNHVGIEEEQWVKGARVVAAYAGESKVTSTKEIDAEARILLEQLGVELVEHPEDLMGKIDAVLIESQEGGTHFSYAKPFLQKGIPTFIDKPFTCSLVEARSLAQLAKKKKVPLFSSSSLRYALEIQKMKASMAETGSIIGAEAYGPAPLHSANPGLFYYGIHAVETLYAIMGPRCKAVWCIYDESGEVVTGLWRDGRIGVVRGARRGPHSYGFTAFCEKQIVSAQINTAFIYRELLKQIVLMFQTGQAPLDIEETVEIVAFIEAALSSAKNQGCKTPLIFIIGMKPEIGDRSIEVRRCDVAAALRSVGVVPGDTIMFHSSLSSMGTVVGGAEAVIDGFIDAVGPTGTVAVPTLWWYETKPPMMLDDWDVDRSPSNVGLITETFRKRPDSVRSDNPTHSVSAIGARAQELTRDHGKSGLRICPFDDTAFAKSSPWERLYQWNAAYCFIGLDFTVNTIGHYIECLFVERALSRAPADKRASLAKRIRRWGKLGVWPTHSFKAMGDQLAEKRLVKFGKIGSATLRCIRTRDMVDNTLAILDSEPDKWFNKDFLNWLLLCHDI